MKDFPKEPSVELLAMFCIRCPGEEVNRHTFGEETLNSEPIEEFIQRDMPGQRRTRVRKIQRFDNETRNVWWIQTDSKYCENVKTDHKSNHVWFSVYGDTICQRCHDEDCNGFVGREFILSPSIVEELSSNVAVDRSTFVSIRDLVPGHWFPQDDGEPVREGGAPVLGSRPRNVARIQSKHSRIRAGAGRGRGRKTAVRGDGEYS